MTLIIHEGGPCAGRVRDVRPDPGANLVYDGPELFGVYVRSEPPRTWPTDDGPAEVWVHRQ